MNRELFERLLYEEEGPTLDFKKEQYRFANATEVEKSELLKDILGFANAWRRATAYILIGVEEVRGGRSIVVGIPESMHLQDHSLQQFVNHLTNRPVQFRYEAFGFEGQQVGIISIEEQHRPVYLRRDYGKLSKDKVYIRRGSSTDPQSPASPEEISGMDAPVAPSTAELSVEFAQIHRDDPLGTSVEWKREFCKMPAPKEIPDWSPPRETGPLGMDISALGLVDPSNLPNRNFFREMARFHFMLRWYKAIRLVVTNVGAVAASNVRVEIELPSLDGVQVVEPDGMPEPPRRRINLVGKCSPNRPALLREPGDVVVVEDNQRIRIEIDCGSLQPGRRVWSEMFFVGKAETGELAFPGRILADNVSPPMEFILTAMVTVAKTTMTVEELRALREPPDE